MLALPIFMGNTDSPYAKITETLRVPAETPFRVVLTTGPPYRLVPPSRQHYALYHLSHVDYLNIEPHDHPLC